MPVSRLRRHGFLPLLDLPEQLEAAREYCYAAWDGEFIKIGKSAKHPHQRVADLQTGNPRTLCLVAYTVEFREAQVHKTLSRYRVRGEWFRASAEVIDFIKGWTWVDAQVLASVSVGGVVR